MRIKVVTLTLASVLVSLSVHSASDTPVLKKVTASDGASGDFFGDFVALDGNTLIVGASLKDGPNSDAGAAYVFVRQGGTWILQQSLAPSDAFSAENFGTAVAVLNDTLAVGAIGDGTSHGAGFVFTRSGTAWSEVQKLSASDGNEDD